MARNPVGQIPAEAFFVTGAISQYLGAALAVELFDHLAPRGVALLRVLGAAVVILLVRGLVRSRIWRGGWRMSRQQQSGSQQQGGSRQPPRHSWTRADLGWAAAFGSTLALMNLSIYIALGELPLGNAVALEFLGPIVVAAVGSRSRRSLLAVALSLVGVAVLAGLQAEGSAKGVGFALLAGAFWAGYIVLGHRVAHRGLSFDGLGVAMLIGAVVILPFGASELGAAVSDPAILVLALATGVASNAIPYGIDQAVMRQLSRTRFALLQALLPVTAVLVGLVALAQRPGLSEMLGIGLVIVAIALSSRDRRADPAQAGFAG